MLPPFGQILKNKDGSEKRKDLKDEWQELKKCDLDMSLSWTQCPLRKVDSSFFQ